MSSWLNLSYQPWVFSRGVGLNLISQKEFKIVLSQLPKKKLSAKCGTPRDPSLPKQYKYCCWSCLPTWTRKTLRTPHTLVTRLGEINLVLTWKRSTSCWLAFRVLKGAVQAACWGRRDVGSGFRATITAGLSRYAHWVILTWMSRV